PQAGGQDREHRDRQEENAEAWPTHSYYSVKLKECMAAGHARDGKDCRRILSSTEAGRVWMPVGKESI
ncbi:MAG TPA: hypothetical protein VN710_08485, partial [Verrucomicrobiae bacterium]|nr:hypothetical protein [Verrucomicrobiae bacterium]